MDSKLSTHQPASCYRSPKLAAPRTSLLTTSIDPLSYCTDLPFASLSLQLASRYDLAVSGDALAHATAVGAADALIPLCQVGEGGEGVDVMLDGWARRGWVVGRDGAGSSWRGEHTAGRGGWR